MGVCLTVEVLSLDGGMFSELFHGSFWTAVQDADILLRGQILPKDIYTPGYFVRPVWAYEMCSYFTVDTDLSTEWLDPNSGLISLKYASKRLADVKSKQIWPTSLQTSAQCLEQLEQIQMLLIQPGSKFRFDLSM